MFKSVFHGMWRGASLCALVLSLLACGCSSLAGSKTATVRVMTYNIHHAEGLDKRIDLQRIAAVIKAEKADIVALQEVDKGTERTGRRDFPAELAALTGMTCIFSNNYSFQGGEYGNAVLTRFPVNSSTNRLLKMTPKNEPRGILQVVMDVEGRPLVFMATHLDAKQDDGERVQSTGEIRELMENYKGMPIIICGDFNDTPNSRTCRRLSEMLVDSWAAAGSGEGFTIPANKPKSRIDYIWISKGAPIVPRKVWVPVTEASDHRPVAAELEFGGR